MEPCLEAMMFMPLRSAVLCQDCLAVSNGKNCLRSAGGLEVDSEYRTVARAEAGADRNRSLRRATSSGPRASVGVLFCLSDAVQLSAAEEGFMRKAATMLLALVGRNQRIGTTETQLEGMVSQRNPRRSRNSRCGDDAIVSQGENMR